MLDTVKYESLQFKLRQVLSFKQLAMLVLPTLDSTGTEPAAATTCANVQHMKNLQKPSWIPLWREEAQEWAQELLEIVVEQRMLTAQQHRLARLAHDLQ